MGVGVIGGGFIGRCHAQAFHAAPMIFDLPVVPRLELLAEIDDDAAERTARSLGFHRWTSDWRALIADPAVDALIEKILAAETRGALTNACRALDRVIRAGRYWIPHWYLAAHRIAYWDMFGFPDKKPGFSRGIPETWWYDPDKAAKLERGR